MAAIGVYGAAVGVIGISWFSKFSALGLSKSPELTLNLDPLGGTYSEDADIQLFSLLESDLPLADARFEKLHESKYLRMSGLWYYSMLRLCRMFEINSLTSACMADDFRDFCPTEQMDHSDTASCSL